MDRRGILRPGRVASAAAVLPNSCYLRIGPEGFKYVDSYRAASVAAGPRDGTVGRQVRQGTPVNDSGQIVS